MQTQPMLTARSVPIFLVAMFASLALFSVMYTVINATGHGVEKAEQLQTIDFVRLRRDSQVESLERRKPPPPPPKPPPPPSKMKVEASSVASGAGGFDMPTVQLNANVTGGAFNGQMGSGGGAGLFDGDIIPLQRIPPQYPRDAARNGITGWVQLEVTVNPDGTVRGCKVMDSKPKGLFEASAVAAVMRWKFKPKVVNGQPVQQKGAQRIEFDLNKAQAS
jgi:periplasmic protein TonB